jgi:predicted phosphoadenosine phosphosulfate sulfurtransferase
LETEKERRKSGLYLVVKRRLSLEIMKNVAGAKSAKMFGAVTKNVGSEKTLLMKGHKSKGWKNYFLKSLIKVKSQEERRQRIYRRKFDQLKRLKAKEHGPDACPKACGYLDCTKALFELVVCDGMEWSGVVSN